MHPQSFIGLLVYGVGLMNIAIAAYIASAYNELIGSVQFYFSEIGTAFNFVTLFFLSLGIIILGFGKMLETIEIRYSNTPNKLRRVS